MQPATPYLTKLPGRSGFYFQRKVPADLIKVIGKRLWRWKAGNTLQEARKATVEGLAKTDEIIATHRGSLAPELLQTLSDNVIPDILTATTHSFKEVDGQEVEVETEMELMPQDLWPRHSQEDAYKLVQVQSGHISKTTDDLLKLATRLKQPAAQTLNNWKDVLNVLVKLAHTNDVTAITEEHARKYRDHLLATVANSSTKTRVNYLKGLFNVAKEENWINSNPFDCIKLRYLKTNTKKKEALSLSCVDTKVLKLSDSQQVLYWIMRYTGTHVSEAAGVLKEDIDLDIGVIHIKPNNLRPLKNQYRERDLPIIQPLAIVLNKWVPAQPPGHLFIELFDSKINRWGQKLTWSRKIGVSPKACRDTVATTLRDHDINERVIGSILGHTPQTSTGQYGAASMEAKLNALNCLVCNQASE